MRHRWSGCGCPSPIAYASDKFLPGAYPCFPAMPARPIFRSVSSGRFSTCVLRYPDRLNQFESAGNLSYVN